MCPWMPNDSFLSWRREIVDFGTGLLDIRTGLLVYAFYYLGVDRDFER